MGRRRPPWMVDVAPARPIPKRFGVFVWDPKGLYPREAAVRIYKREHAADRFAAANIGRNYVVRSIWWPEDEIEAGS